MLDKRIIENVLTAALDAGGDFAEIFVEDRVSNSITMVGQEVDKSLSGRDYGIGIRIFEGYNSVYGYTNDSSEENLIKLARQVAKAFKKDESLTSLNLMKTEVEKKSEILLMPLGQSKNKKVDFLRRVNSASKNYDPIISQVTAMYFDEVQNVLIANSEGLLKEDQRVRTRIFGQAVASHGNEMQVGFEAPGASMGLEFYDKIDLEAVGREAGRIAKTMVLAEECPSGKMPVIMHNAFGGVLFHEACGHGLEATSVAKGSSVFCNKLGEQVASPLVTAIDDGTLANEWGTLNIDDEGEETKRNVLIENGILKSYLVDKLNSRKMNHKTTGSSRRQSYKYHPTSRMNNTYIANGESSFDEIIGNTDYGLFAKKLGGGSVDPATGEFNFSVMEGYIVRNGEIKEPVRGATLIGKGIEVLEKIDMVGDNLEYGQGMCGSLSGSVPVNVGQPTIRVKDITVGGKGGSK